MVIGGIHDGEVTRQVYMSEFRQAVEMGLREGLGIAEASRRLSLSPKTLTNWVSRAKGGSAAEVAAAAPRREVTEAEAELSRLRRENAELRMERDILKKDCVAKIIFERGSLLKVSR